MDTITSAKYYRGNRLNPEKVETQIKYFRSIPLLATLLDAVSVMVIIINNCRQVVFGNRAFLAFAEINDLEEVLGLRSGEILKCIHANDSALGCGEAEACKYCSVLRVIFRTVDSNKPQQGEAALIAGLDEEQSLTLSITAVPLMIGEDSYFAVSFTDVSDVVKKRMLERLFFHDIINTAGALQGLLELLKDEVPEKVRPDIDFVTRTFRFLNDDILAQKQLTNAENNELSLRPEKLDSVAILRSVVKLYEEHEAADGKRIVIISRSENIGLRSDPALLRRVIGNMLKNALEASATGMTVEMGCEKQGETVRFWVRNNAYMEPIIQHGIFMRSVSTKGAGRGLGTYSIKLLGEKYLKGKVGFNSSRQEGTTFFINVPVEIQGTARGLS